MTLRTTLEVAWKVAVLLLLGANCYLQYEVLENVEPLNTDQTTQSVDRLRASVEYLGHDVNRIGGDISAIDSSLRSLRREMPLVR